MRGDEPVCSEVCERLDPVHPRSLVNAFSEDEREREKEETYASDFPQSGTGGSSPPKAARTCAVMIGSR